MGGLFQGDKKKGFYHVLHFSSLISFLLILYRLLYFQEANSMEKSPRAYPLRLSSSIPSFRCSRI